MDQELSELREKLVGVRWGQFVISNNIHSAQDAHLGYPHFCSNVTYLNYFFIRGVHLKRHAVAVLARNKFVVIHHLPEHLAFCTCSMCSIPISSIHIPGDGSGASAAVQQLQLMRERNLFLALNGGYVIRPNTTGEASYEQTQIEPAVHC